MNSRDTRKTFRAGEILIHQGERGTCAYILEEGKVEVFTVNSAGQKMQIATRGPGTMVGEMAIVDDAARVSTVQALTDCKVLEITRQHYLERMKNCDPMLQTITQVIVSRYRHVLDYLRTLNPSVVVSQESEERLVLSSSPLVESIKMANEFEEALHNGQAIPWYQPVVDMSTGQIVSIEALLRWFHPELGSIPPSVFIPVAEKSGLITTTNQWVLAKACDDLKKLEKSTKLASTLSLNINFSGVDFEESDFVQNVLGVLESSATSPSRIHMEITESLLVQYPQEAAQALRSFREAGIQIALDDFGTGYSSLSYLHNFPIDILKIDQSFIHTMLEDKRNLKLVRSILALARSLELKTVAEGVETFEQAHTLSNMRCHCIQGYYYSKPVPVEELPTLLRNWDPQDKIFF